MKNKICLTIKIVLIIVLIALAVVLIVLYKQEIIDGITLTYLGSLVGGIFTLLGVLISTSYLREEAKKRIRPIIKHVSTRQVILYEKELKRCLDIVWAPFEKIDMPNESENFYRLNLATFKNNIFTYDLLIQNIGSGPAIDIFIEDISKTNYHFVSKIDLLSDETSLNDSNKYNTFICENIFNEKKYGFKVSNRLNPVDTMVIRIHYIYTDKIEFPSYFIIKYKDIENNDYYKAFEIICIGQNNLQIRELD